MNRAVVVILAAALIGCGACAASEDSGQSSEPQSTSGAMVSLTAEQLVQQLRREGLEVGHPAPAGGTDCAEAGCTQAVVTDRFRLLTFPTTGAAQIYAADHGMRQIETVAVGFAPVVTPAEQDRYWSAIVRLVA